MQPNRVRFYSLIVLRSQPRRHTLRALGALPTRAFLLAAVVAPLAIAGCGSSGPSGPPKLRASSLLAEQTSSDAVVAEFTVKNLGGSAGRVSCLTVVAPSGSDVGVATIQIPTIQPKGKWQVVRKIALGHPDPYSRSTDMAVTCGHAQTVQFVGVPHAPIARPPSKPAPTVAAKPQTFSGAGSENIGTITVPGSSTLTWSCPTCASGNFIINNGVNDSAQIGVNSLDQASGKTVIDAGTYTDVSINTEGQSWTITITPGNSTQTTTSPSPSASKPQTFSGAGSENIGTITVPASSTLAWSCASCGSGNFIINNSINDDSQIGVNALDQTSGKTVIDAGTYTDVAINTEGQDWTITLTPGNSTQAAPTTPTPASVASLLWKGWYGIALGVKDHDTASALSSANVVCSLFSPPVAQGWIKLVKNQNGHSDTCPVALVVATSIAHQSPSEFSNWQHVKTLHQTATTAVCELENPSWGNPTVHLGLYSGTWLMVQWKGNG